MNTYFYYQTKVINFINMCLCSTTAFKIPSADTVRRRLAKEVGTPYR